jgi:pimeloyl-ACP methyl ester carboxylesterase
MKYMHFMQEGEVRILIQERARIGPCRMQGFFTSRHIYPLDCHKYPAYTIGLLPTFVGTKKHKMYKYIITCLTIATVISLATSCQSGLENEKNTSTETRDTTVSKNTKPTESGYADVNGLKLYYEVYGSGKPIVLLHGSFMTIPLNWSQIIPLFNDRKVIVAEMQGHGRTKDIDRAMSYEASSDDISGLLKHLKIDSADILGYSMGGGIAFQFAVRHPEQLRRLVILSGTYAHDGWWPDVEKSFGTINADMFKGSIIQKQYDSLGNDPAHFDEFVKKVMSMDLKPYNWSAEVKKIQAPIFMAIGDADGVRYEHALELFRAKGGGKMGDMYGLPKSRFAIIPGTTHIGMMQRTDLLIPMITDFLDSDLNTAPPTF